MKQTPLERLKSRIRQQERVERMACVASDEEFIEVERARVQRAAMIITKLDRIRYREDFRVMGSGC